MWFPIVPDDQERLQLIPDCHAWRADPPIQHSYDTQSLDNVSLHQIGADGGESKSSLSVHPQSPFEVRRRSKVSRHMHKLVPRRDQAMSKPPVSHLPPHRAPPALEALGARPPAPPSPLLRPLPTMAFTSTPHLPLSLNARPYSFPDQQLQGLTGSTMRFDYPDFKKGPRDLHPQLPLSPAHKNSIERAPSANLCTQRKNQWSTLSQTPTMRHGIQQVTPQYGAPAVQETEHSRGFNRPPESSGQSLCSLHAISSLTRRDDLLCIHDSSVESAGPPFRPDALGSMQFLLTAVNHGNQIKQRQGTHDSRRDDPRDEATGTDVPTNSKTRKCNRAARGPVIWDVSSYRTPLPPSQLEVNNETDYDNGRKYRAAHTITPHLPWQAFYMLAAAFESWDTSAPVPSLSREPPDTRQVLQENLSLLHKESQTEARLARSSLPLSMVSSLSSGSKPYISSELQVAGSLGKCTSSPSTIELNDKQNHRSTIDVPIPMEPEKYSCRRAISHILQNSNSTLSDSSLLSPPFPAPPANSPPPTHRRRPRKEPLSTQSAHGGRSSLSPVVRPRRESVAAKATLDTGKSTITAPTPPLVGASQQAKREVSRASFNYSQTPRGSESLASIFDGDLSDLEEDRVPLSGAVPNNACSTLPETISGIRLNMMWRTVAPVKVPQRYRERLAVTPKGIKNGGYGTFRTTNDNTARNAVLARAKKVEQGGISGIVSDPNVDVRSHEGQNIADAELRRMLALLTLIRSPPEK